MNLIIALYLFLSSVGPSQGTLEETLTEAKKDNKQVLLYFSGSDWCLPCIKFKKAVLDDPEFKSSTQASTLIYQVDFPRNDTSDDEGLAYKKQIAKRYNPEGSFPKVLLLDSGGNMLWEKDGYQNESAEVFLQRMQTAQLSRRP